VTLATRCASISSALQKVRGVSLEELLQLGDKDLHDLFLRTPEQKPNLRVQALFALMPRFEKELKKRGVTQELLWHEYRALHADGFQLSQFSAYSDASRPPIPTSSTIITSQIPVGAWHDVIGEKTVADAILDRLIYGAHRLELRGESLRKKANTSLESSHS